MNSQRKIGRYTLIERLQRGTSREKLGDTCTVDWGKWVRRYHCTQNKVLNLKTSQFRNEIQSKWSNPISTWRSWAEIWHVSAYSLNGCKLFLDDATNISFFVSLSVVFFKYCCISLCMGVDLGKHGSPLIFGDERILTHSYTHLFLNEINNNMPSRKSKFHNLTKNEIELKLIRRREASKCNFLQFEVFSFSFLFFDARSANQWCCSALIEYGIQV